MWVRGLKHAGRQRKLTIQKSHPMWVRGLKRLFLSYQLFVLLSHPMWVRGLKLGIGDYVFQPFGRTPCGCVD